MPPAELKEWVTLGKDALLGVAALVTTIIGIYGARVWQRELAGREIYAASKALVVESHLVAKAANRARKPVRDYERLRFSAEEVKNTTKNERWCLSEAAVYRKRLDEFSEAAERYQRALLEVRVLVGSKVFLAFLPFTKLMTEVVFRICNYIDVIDDSSQVVFPESEEVRIAQAELYPSDNFDDDLSQNIADTREDGEKNLLTFLHRSSIRG